MNKKASLALATGILLVSAAAASAAGPQSTSTPKAPPTASSTMSRPATDRLDLTSTEQKSAWNALNRQATNQSAPSGFQPQVGAMVPSSIKLEPVPSKAATDVPSLKPFDFAMVQGKLLIVSPSDKKIADVIAG